MCGTETPKCKSKSSNGNAISKEHVVLNLDHGDPTVYEGYWSSEKMEEKCTVVIKGSELMGYVSDVGKACWFMEAGLDAAIRNLHRVTGNADVEGRHVVVGTGSTQLYHAVLYALTATTHLAGDRPVSVVSAAPYYSQYPDETDFLRSGLFKWDGDAHAFDGEGPYIEVVTSPNNPDGIVRCEGVVNKKWADQGKTFYDLAYYWPQYTPITHAADYDIMSFTFSKSTGHAGSRIGWAIVKDEEIARRMTRFIELCSIGVSKDSQIRAAKIMGVICDGYEDFRLKSPHNFFEHGHKVMAGRWKRLREAVAQSGAFTLPNYPRQYCRFFGDYADSNPGFAWLKVKQGVEEDCEKFLKEFKILGRGGKRFGADPSYARVSMLGRDQVFEAFIERLSAIKGIHTN